MVLLSLGSRTAPPSRDAIRGNQTKTLMELRPVVQDLEKASRDALNAWRIFTESMETIANLYDQCATLLPSASSAGELGLDADLGIPAETMKLCKTFKKTVHLWSVSDEVVDVRAQLFAEWAVWRRAERRLSIATDAAIARKTQQAQLKSLQHTLHDLRKKGKSSEVDAQEKSLQASISGLKQEMKAQDDSVTSELKVLVKKSILREPTGVGKTGYVLRRVGRNIAKAFDAFTKGGEAFEFATPDITQTPTMGVPLELDYPSSQHSQPASPASMEAEYGQGALYMESLELPAGLATEDSRDFIAVS